MLLCVIKYIRLRKNKYLNRTDIPVCFHLLHFCSVTPNNFSQCICLFRDFTAMVKEYNLHPLSVALSSCFVIGPVFVLLFTFNLLVLGPLVPFQKKYVDNVVWAAEVTSLANCLVKPCYVEISQ